jgi:hypothetical protein
VVHVSDFIYETIGHLKLSDDQITDQLKLPDKQRLTAFEARKITHPGKGFDVWWDLPQLTDQVKIAIKVFKHTVMVPLRPSFVDLYCSRLLLQSNVPFDVHYDK